MNFKMFEELAHAFKSISNNPDCRCVLLRGHGDAFSGGLDLEDVSSTVFGASESHSDDIARRAGKFADKLQTLQDGAGGPETCRIPVIAVLHGYVRTTAMDLTCSADIRLTTKDTKFGLNEIDLGLCSDLGPFQRIPKVIGNESWLRELIFTGREFDGAEALERGYVSHAYDTNEQLFEEATKMAKTIAAKSPVGLIGAKKTLIYARDHSVPDGLEQIKTWNSVMLQTRDIGTAIQSKTENKTPKFDNF
jgi:delta(3,5)-delta(2,4)-dienoyl-CoA isomerase